MRRADENQRTSTQDGDLEQPERKEGGLRNDENSRQNVRFQNRISKPLLMEEKRTTGMFSHGG